MIIGVTGNSGTGKTEISRLLAEKINAEVVDADKVVKEITKPGNVYFEKMVELFGRDILENNNVNRKKVAEIIYKNESMRNKLNELTYKYVVEEIKSRIKQANSENIIIDAPLLFESGLNKICKITLGVISNKENKIKRICTRDKIESKIAKARLSIQAKDDFYEKNADYIITNDGNIEEINLEEICTKIGKN